MAATLKIYQSLFGIVAGYVDPGSLPHHCVCSPPYLQNINALRANRAPPCHVVPVVVVAWYIVHKRTSVADDWRCQCTREHVPPESCAISGRVRANPSSQFRGVSNM